MTGRLLFPLGAFEIQEMSFGCLGLERVGSKRPRVGRSDRETHDEALYKLLDGALMLVPK